MTVKVKVCGVTRVEDARAAIASGASLLGLNRADNGLDLTDASSRVRLYGGEPVAPDLVRTGPRVGVAAAHDTPWRFWVDGSPAVSAYRPGRGAPQATG